MTGNKPGAKGTKKRQQEPRTKNEKEKEEEIEGEEEEEEEIPNLYEVLGVNSKATAKEIKQAYYKLALQVALSNVIFTPSAHLILVGSSRQKCRRLWSRNKIQRD